MKSSWNRPKVILWSYPEELEAKRWKFCTLDKQTNGWHFINYAKEVSKREANKRAQERAQPRAWERTQEKAQQWAQKEELKRALKGAII